MADSIDFPEVGTRGLKPGEPISNPDGTKSSERTITVGFDDGFRLIPTIVVDDEGFLVKVSDDDAIRLFREGRNPSVGRFNTEQEATAFAKQRSDSGGRNSKIEPVKPLSEIIQKPL